MQIVVLGMHRSGTSATTRLINMMGAYFGPEKNTLGANSDNLKGFWERSDVHKLTSAMLQARGCSWFNLKDWIFKDIRSISDGQAKSIQNLVMDMDAHRPWVLKDPRLCLLLPAWKQYLEAPVAVIAYRDPMEIALSLQKRNKFPTEFSLALWEYYAVGALNASRNMPRIFVQHDKVLSRPIQATAELYGMLCAHEVKGLHMPSVREIQAFIDPALYRARREKNADSPLTKEQERLKKLIRGDGNAGEALSVSDAAQKIMKEMGGTLKVA